MLRIAALKKQTAPLAPAATRCPNRTRALQVVSRPAKDCARLWVTRALHTDVTTASSGPPTFGKRSPDAELVSDTLPGIFSVPYRSGDAAAAIVVCLQPCVVIALDESDALRMLVSAATPPDSAFRLPGMQSEERDGNGDLADLRPLQVLAQVSPQSFWASLPQAMTAEGRELFAHFNAGLTEPSTSKHCYMRLRAYVNWLRNLAD